MADACLVCLFVLNKRHLKPPTLQEYFHRVIWSVTLKISALTNLGLFFPVVCFIHVFGQTLAEQLYRDKGL